ncbi:MAG: BatD family protein [Ferruginibacter sp.]
MKLFLRNLILLLFILAASTTAAQTNFVATISPPQIYKNEYATLRLMVENGETIEKITPPNLKDFTLVGPPSQETGSNAIIGSTIKKTDYVVISYLLKPRRSGRLNLGRAVAIVNGKTYKSKPIIINIKDGTGSTLNNTSPANPFAIIDPFEPQQQPQEEYKDYILHKGDNIAEKIERNMQLRLETDKSTVYVGEPLVASYNLYTRLKSESRLTKNPSFNGFSVIDLQRPDAYDFSKKKLNGREYNVYTIRKVQLYPLQHGRFELETATVENEVQFLKEEAAHGRQSVDDIFNSPGFNPDHMLVQKLNLSSKPVTVTVKPLPESGKPASFDGAVGDFDMSVSVQKNTMSTDETGLLSISISGAGNMELITVPQVSWPAGIDVFDYRLRDNLVTTDVPVSGTKIFEIPFAVNKEGNYEVPAVEFSFFDPRSAGYKSVKSKPILLNISKATGNEKTFTNIKPGKKEQLSPLNRLFSNRPLVVTLIAAFIIGGLIFWLRKEQKKEEAVQLEKKRAAEEELTKIAALAATAPQNPLEQSEECLYREDCLEFYVLLNKELKNFFAKKFSIHPQDISVKKIAHAMDQAGMQNENILKLEELLHDVEWQLYTPSLSADERRLVYSRAQEAIQFVNSYLPTTL